MIKVELYINHVYACSFWADSVEVKHDKNPRYLFYDEHNMLLATVFADVFELRMQEHCTSGIDLYKFYQGV